MDINSLIANPNNWKKTSRKVHEVYACVPPVGTQVKCEITNRVLETSSQNKVVLFGQFGYSLLPVNDLRLNYVTVTGQAITNSLLESKIEGTSQTGKYVDWFKIKSKTTNAITWAFRIPEEVRNYPIEDYAGNVITVNNNKTYCDFLVCPDCGGMPFFGKMTICSGVEFELTYDMRAFPGKTVGFKTTELNKPPKLVNDRQMQSKKKEDEDRQTQSKKKEDEDRQTNYIDKLLNGEESDTLYCFHKEIEMMETQNQNNEDKIITETLKSNVKLLEEQLKTLRPAAEHISEEVTKAVGEGYFRALLNKNVSTKTRVVSGLKENIDIVSFNIVFEGSRCIECNMSKHMMVCDIKSIMGHNNSIRVKAQVSVHNKDTGETIINKHTIIDRPVNELTGKSGELIMSDIGKKLAASVNTSVEHREKNNTLMGSIASVFGRFKR